MSNGEKDVMARAVYLAQLEAAKGDCDCRACQILRQATEKMSQQFLSEPPPESIKVTKRRQRSS